MENKLSQKQYHLVNEVFNAITHGIGTALAIAGLVLLLVKGARHGSAIEIVAYAIYGATLIMLFLASTLYHSLIFTKARGVMRVFDHSSIYLLIAGSYTPFCLLTIQGPVGWLLFVVIWLLAIFGIVQKALYLDAKKKTGVWIYIAMGWLCLVAVKPLYQGLGLNGTLLLALGGVAYTIGAIFYKMKKIKFMHVVWHLFVMLGAALMFFSIYFYT